MNREQRRKHARLQRQLDAEEPVFEFTTPTRGHLQASGAVISTDIGIAKSHADVLHAGGHPIPAPVHAAFLIDTGASKSLVRHDIAERAGLKLINDSHPIHGIGVDSTGRVYLGSIRFKFSSRKIQGGFHEIWVNAEIASGTLPVKEIDGLIGRDVLAFFRLTYDGFAGKIAMRYMGPKT